MADRSITAKGNKGLLPADDLSRALIVADPDDPRARSISVVGDIYTILISGKDTEGRYCLIDMLVPDGSGPPLHRHDFEEMFSLLEGELQFAFRGKTRSVRAPATVNIPANAPHQFRNTSGKTVHMLCMCAPAGQDELFMAIGIPVASRSATPPKPSREEQAALAARAMELAPKYRTEILQKP